MKQSRIKTTLLSLFIFLISLFSLVPFLDTLSYEHHQKAFERSLATFAVAKGLNGIISVFQGTEIEGSVVFASATFTIGEFLDPVNDLIERFSWVMLVSTIALGIEKLLIQMGAVFGLKVIIGVFAFCSLLTLWIPKLWFAKYWMLRIFAILIIFRLIFPLLEGTNNIVYRHFTEPMYQDATKSLTLASDELKKVKDDIGKKDSSFFENLQQRFEKTSQEMIAMMVIFSLHSLLMPLLFLWGGFRVVLFLAAAPAAAPPSQPVIETLPSSGT